MLSVSAFDPLSRSMNPMLKEESFHLGTGNNGLLRIVKAGKMPPEVIQRFFYKWIPTAFDLFGTDNSSSARSEEHTSELQSRLHLVCRLLLEKKKRKERERDTQNN